MTNNVKHTYVISHSEYMYEAEYMSEFTGTYRELLEHLHGITSDTDEETLREYADFSDDELVKMFADGNGDGQSFVMIWNVDEHKQVLG